jgi:hypothetical protein
LLVADTSGALQAAQIIHPRSAFDELAVPAPGADHVRLAGTGYVNVGFVGRLAVSSVAPNVQAAALLSAQGARLGDVFETVATADSLGATLTGPDTLHLTYSLPEESGEARDLFLVVDATPLGAQSTPSTKLQQVERELPPVRFALEQNRPNPFSGKTMIRFALPTATSVRLEVFDPAGRQARTLAVGSFAPGYHSVEWDHRDAGGNLVRPGVYLYRLIAGSFRDQKKMVLLAQ